MKPLTSLTSASRIGLSFLTASCLLLFPHPIARAQGPYTPISTATFTGPLSLESATYANTLHITVGQTIVLTSGAALKRVYIGDPKIIHSFSSGQHEVLITSKVAGLSSLVVWDMEGKHRLYTISSDLDLTSLHGALNDAFPQGDLHADASQGRIILKGTVASADESAEAAKLAATYSKDIVNDIRIVPTHGKQVQLKLRIVEVDRTRLEQFGFNFLSGGNNASGATTQQFGSTSYAPVTTGGLQATISDPLSLFFFSSAHNVGVTVKDLEQKQILQVLAEPTLTTISGQEARFLSGGEFPFPVVEGGIGSTTAITIQFRPYGVKVNFTPTVNADNTIHLKVSPEVSALDYTNAVTISGFTIPALSTRRADTDVEIRNGESFVVSGLLDHRTTDSLSKVPGIADVPILGQLFRSKNVNHSVVELVIVVTATIVDPLKGPAPVNEPKLALPVLSSSAFDSSLKNSKAADSASTVHKGDQQ
jgi:pilus assembly protein CpaC